MTAIVSPMEGTPFGRYQLLELLGRGEKGEVWRAHDTTIDRVVAIKILLSQYAEDPLYDKRFRVEASAAARLDWRNSTNATGMDSTTSSRAYGAAAA